MHNCLPGITPRCPTDTSNSTGLKLNSLSFPHLLLCFQSQLITLSYKANFIFYSFPSLTHTNSHSLSPPDSKHLSSSSSLLSLHCTICTAGRLTSADVTSAISQLVSLTPDCPPANTLSTLHLWIFIICMLDYLFPLLKLLLFKDTQTTSKSLVWLAKPIFLSYSSICTTCHNPFKKQIPIPAISNDFLQNTLIGYAFLTFLQVWVGLPSGCSTSLCTCVL